MLTTGADIIEKFKDASCVGMLDDYGLANLTARPVRPVPAELWRRFGYSPNAWAMVHVHTSGARFNAVCTCRQCGKTEALAMEIADAMTAPPKRGDEKSLWNDCNEPNEDGSCSHGDQMTAGPHDGSLIYAAPNYVGVVSFDLEHAAKSVARYLFHVHSALGEKAYKLNKNDKTLTLVGNGATLRWYSAKNPESVQGETFTFLLFDEAQNIADIVWENARPALDVRMAGVLAVGTPDPRPDCTWFKGLFLKGEELDEDDYYSYTLPCWENRWMTIETIEQARNDMSEAEFRKKYLGQWVDDDSAVFRNVDSNFTGRLYEGPKDPKALADGVVGPFVIGCDVARGPDYTVAYVMEVKTRRIVDRFRMNHLSFERAKEAIIGLYQKWGCRGVNIDMTALGYGLYELLKKTPGITVWGVDFTASLKEKLVATAAREIEKGNCILPTEDRNLRRELKAYTRVVLPSGNIRFTAPSNYNDDTVMALGLALLKAGRSGKVGSSSYI